MCNLLSLDLRIEPDGCQCCPNLHQHFLCILYQSDSKFTSPLTNPPSRVILKSIFFAAATPLPHFLNTYISSSLLLLSTEYPKPYRHPSRYRHTQEVEVSSNTLSAMFQDILTLKETDVLYEDWSCLPVPGVVSVVGVEGRVIHSYGQSQILDFRQIEYFSDLCVTKNDDILVIDENNRRILLIIRSTTVYKSWLCQLLV